MDWKLWISSLIFVLVTVLKLVFPEQTDDIRRQTVALIDMDMDYRVWAVEAGSLLSDESVNEVFDVSHSNEVTETGELLFPLTPVPSPDAPQSSTVSKEIIDRVDAFHLSQEAFAAYDTPANVSYEYLQIPFSFTSPVSAVCSSGFGYRMHPIDGEVAFHYGTDYDVKEGTTILSFGDGTVTAVGEESGYGKYICIDHGNDWKTLYAHCSTVSVSSGQRVRKGEAIGESGQTGRVTGPHLHFELTYKGFYTNPEFFLS